MLIICHICFVTTGWVSLSTCFRSCFNQSVYSHSQEGEKFHQAFLVGDNLGGLVDELLHVVLAEAAVTGVVHAADDAHGLVLLTATTRTDSGARPARAAACCARDSTDRSAAAAPSAAATDAIAGAADPPPSSSVAAAAVAAVRGSRLLCVEAVRVVWLNLLYLICFLRKWALEAGTVIKQLIVHFFLLSWLFYATNFGRNTANKFSSIQFSNTYACWFCANVLGHVLSLVASW
jgi:hypothetical protein